MKPKGTQFPIDPPDREDTAFTGVQLPMFMTASDLQDSITITGDQMAGTRTPREVLSIKSLNSQQQMGRGRGSGVYNAIAAEGVGHPVQLIHTDSDIMMGDGHHRVSAAIDQMKTGQPLGLQRGDPAERFIPVIHTDRPDMSRYPGYETDDIRGAIAEAHNFRNYSDDAFLQHQQFKARQVGEEF